MSERRQAERLLCNVDCEILTTAFDMYQGVIKNISKLGMGIYIPYDISNNLTGECIDITVKSFKVKGQVVRHDQTEDLNCFLGIWIDNMTDDDFSDLMFYCSV